MTSVLLWQAGNGGFRDPFEYRSVYPSTRFFLGALAAGHLQEKILAVISSAWINTCALHCSHRVSEQPLLGLYLGQRRPISYSMICEDIPRHCLKFLPLGSTLSFSCNGQILLAQAAQESPCTWRKARLGGGRTYFLREHIAVVHPLLQDTEF